MKRILAILLALSLCFCAILSLSSCGKKGGEKDSDSESASDGGEETNPAEEDVEDTDPATSEEIFSAMKTAYNNALTYNGAYTVNVDWTENQSDSQEGKGASATSSKYSTKELHTADPANGLSVYVANHEEYENGNMLTSSTQSRKLYSDGGKHYLFNSAESDGQVAASTYHSLSGYGLENESDYMLLKTFFVTKAHFAESFGDPFSALSASDLKSVNNTVINEIKANQKALYESQGYTVKQLNASVSVSFNKTSDTEIMKRSVSILSNIQNEGGTYSNNLTIDSLLKTKGGKIVSFSSISTVNKTENLESGDTYQTESSSSLTYTFDYEFSKAKFDSIATVTPSEVSVAPDYFETPVTFVINGNEVTVSVLGETDDQTPVYAILEGAISTLFADTAIEYDKKWYTDAACTKELDITTITTIDKIKNLGKLYNNGFEVNGNNALFIDSGITTLNIPANYKTVFGDTLIAGVDSAAVSISEIGEENFYRIRFEKTHGKNTTIKLNNEALDTSDPESFLEDSDGTFYHEILFEGGNIYFINRSSVINKTFLTLDSYYVSF